MILGAGERCRTPPTSLMLGAQPSAPNPRSLVVLSCWWLVGTEKGHEIIAVPEMIENYVHTHMYICMYMYVHMHTQCTYSKVKFYGVTPLFPSDNP